MYIDLNTEGLLTNYSATNFRLVMWAQDQVASLDRRLEEMRKSGAPADSIEALEREKKQRVAFAEKYLELNARILPREWRNNYYGAQFYAGLKDYAKAEEYYRRGMASEAPNTRLFAANLAQLYVEQGDFPKAESLLSDLKDRNPNDFEIWYQLSEIYQRQGQPDKARQVLAEWLKNNPSHQYANMVQQQLQFLDAQRSRMSPPAGRAGDTGAGSAAPGAGGIPGLAPAPAAGGAASPAGNPAPEGKAPTGAGDTAGKKAPAKPNG